MRTTVPRRAPAGDRPARTHPLRLSGGAAALLILIGCLGLAAATLLLPSIPSYDAWSWLIWGREVIHLDLSTTGGPTWKPLPVLFTTVFALFGKAAPGLWIVVARASGFMALVLAFRVARRLVGPGVPGLAAGAIAAVGVATAPGFFRMMGLATSEGLLMALSLLALDRHMAGRHRAAFVAGFFVGLLRPDAWPLLAVYGIWLVRRDRSSWPLVAGLAALIPAAWLLPEWWGSGDPLRGSHRAKLPDRTTYLAYLHPARQALHDAWHCVLQPIGLGAALALALELGGFARRRPRAEVLVAAAGAVAWLAIVVVMVARGYAGTPRYFMGAAAVIAMLGGVGWGGLASVVGALAGSRRAIASVLGAVVGIGAFALIARYERPELPGERDEARSIREAARARDTLPAAIDRAGGRRRILACGPARTLAAARPIVAWYLDAPERRIATHRRRHGFVIQIRRHGSDHFGPRAPAGARTVARVGDWRILSGRCVRAG
jgi:hypothetical protein